MIVRIYRLKWSIVRENSHAVLQNQIQSWKSFCSAAESDPVLEVILQCCSIRSSPGSHSAVLLNQIQSWKSFCSAAQSDPVLEVILQCCRMTSSPASSEAAGQDVMPDHNLNVVFEAGFQQPPIRKFRDPDLGRRFVAEEEIRLSR